MASRRLFISGFRQVYGQEAVVTMPVNESIPFDGATFFF